LKELSTKRDDFEYVEHKIDESKEEKVFFDETTSKLKLVKGTPIIYIDGHIIQGFNTADTTGKEIENLIEVTGSNLMGLLAAAGNVPSIEKITKSNAEHAINRLLNKLNEQQAKDDEDIPL